jgi:hypothetical protein
MTLDEAKVKYFSELRGKWPEGLEFRFKAPDREMAAEMAEELAEICRDPRPIFVIAPDGEFIVNFRKPELSEREKARVSEIRSRFPMVEQTGEKTKLERGNMFRNLREAVDLYSALSSLESGLKKFIELADDPMGPMEEVAEKAKEIAAAYEAGEVVRPQDLPDPDKISNAFSRVYRAFQKVRDAAYEVAKLVGESTTTSGAPRKKSKDISGFSNTELLKDIERMAGGLHNAFSEVQNAGAKVLAMVKRTLDEMDKGKDGVEDAKAVVREFLKFRTSVGEKYYAVMGGIARRLNRLMERITRERPVLQKSDPKTKLTEEIVIPWEDEFPVMEDADDMEYEKDDDWPMRPKEPTVAGVGLTRVERLLRDLKRQLNVEKY